MGIDAKVARFLFGAKAAGTDYSRSLMIGRQFFYPEYADLAQMLKRQRLHVSANDLLRQSEGWAETFFRLLGANTVDSMDASAFEGASIVHDLNLPVDRSLHARFTAIFDGGTLEHVFHFPQAIENCMSMLTLGGSFIQVAPANNFMGHGFYQFSPELLYQVFSSANGFRIRVMLLQEDVRGGKSFVVANPGVVGKRVQLTNRLPTYLCTIARRDRITPIFAAPPRQADYADAWQAGQSAPAYASRGGRLRTAVRSALRHLPPGSERLIRSWVNREFRAQPDCFKLIDADQILLGQFP
jgi:hypothetical protein